MTLTGTVLRCSARKVNASGAQETHVTNLLISDPDNASGMNYQVEVWDKKPHEVVLKSEVTLTIVGVVGRNTAVPVLRGRIDDDDSAAA
jgi:hypothetical protein